MFLNHFGLRVYPYSLTPDTDLFFSGGGHGPILDTLLRAIISGEGFIKVVGEVGSGKTMLCRLLCQRLPANIQSALLLNPNLSPKNLLSAILQEFRLTSVEKKDKLAERQILLDHLVKLNRNGQRALILIEEAHCMPEATLESLRLLSNLETGRAKLMQIILFGQPGLDRNLRTDATRQMLERCTTSITLPALSLKDTDAYLQYRLQASGYHLDRLFSKQAVRCIHRTTQGRMGQINILANKALQIACNDSAKMIQNKHVLQAINHSEMPRKVACWYRPALVTAGVAALLASGIVLHSWATNPLLATMYPSVKAINTIVEQRVSHLLVAETQPLVHLTRLEQESKGSAMTVAADIQSEASIVEDSSRTVADKQDGSSETPVDVSLPYALTHESVNSAETVRETKVLADQSEATIESTVVPYAIPHEVVRADAMAANPIAPYAITNESVSLRKIATEFDAPYAITNESVTVSETVIDSKPPDVITHAAVNQSLPAEEKPLLSIQSETAAAPVVVASAEIPNQWERFTDQPDFSMAIPPLPYLKANDALREEILAAHHWLEMGKDDHYSIQIVLLHNEGGIEQLQKQLGGMMPPLTQLDMKIFRLKNDYLLIYLNEFGSYKESLQILHRLPANLKAGNPSIRSLARLKQTIRKLALVQTESSG